VRTYRIDRIQSVRITTRPFQPRFAVEVAFTGASPAPPVVRRTGGNPRASTWARDAARYTLECPLCHKHFVRQRPTARLNPHKNGQGHPCRGRVGRLV